MPRLHSPESPEDKLSEKLSAILDGSDLLRWRLDEAKKYCFDAKMNGHPPSEHFVQFSQRCMEAGDFAIAREAYSYGTKQQMPDDLWTAGTLKYRKRLEDLDMDPVLIAMAIQRKVAECLSHIQKKSEKTPSLAA